MPRSTRDADVSHDLRQAIHRTGYYPEVVADGVFSAAGGEEVLAYFVHHETTFDHEEVRRHLTALLLTPTRLVIAHTDEHPGDDMLPEPYTSTTTEAVTLTSIRTVVVTRMVANPTQGVAPPAEAVLTIGWGGVGRVDLEPAGCSDPDARPTTATPARSPATTTRCASPPPPRAPTPSARCSRSPTRSPHAPADTPRGPASPRRPTATARWPTCCRRSPARSASPLDGHPVGLELPRAPSYVVFLVDGLGAELLARTAMPRRTSPRSWRAAPPVRPGSRRRPPPSLTSLGTGLAPGAHGLVGFTARIPGTDQLLNHLWWDKRVDPLEWQPHPTAFGRLARAGVHVTSVNKREFDGSGLTVASQRGATYVGADRSGSASPAPSAPRRTTRR